jgi:hypothetical protein
MVDDVLQLSMEAMRSDEVELDDEIYYPGWQQFEEDARKNLVAYNAHIRVCVCFF